MTDCDCNFETGSQEIERLAALQSYEILDTAPEVAFTEMARLAATIAGTPVALISLVDGSRQWFKAKVGTSITETPRSAAFCAHTIQGRELFVIPDATRDERFCANPLVTGEPNIRFYAGAPLLTPEGHAIGALCIMDSIPRELSSEERLALETLSQHVMAQLE